MTEAEKYLKNDKVGSTLYGELDQEDIKEFTQIMQGYADQQLLIHGVVSGSYGCPNCGSKDIEELVMVVPNMEYLEYCRCLKCKHEFVE